MKTLHTRALRLQIFNVVSAAGVLGQQPVQQEQAEGDEDDHLGDGHVRRVLAPHPGQTRKRCLTMFLLIAESVNLKLGCLSVKIFIPRVKDFCFQSRQ